MTPVPGVALSIVINEVAWAGTKSSTDDEWIELYNPTNHTIDLTGWRLSSSDGSPEIKTDFKGLRLGANQYLLLERTDDDATDAPADIIYSGSLTNTGETLRLYDANGYLIDTANGNGGDWPAGIASTYSSMQRGVIAADGDRVWVTYDATTDSVAKNKDAGGNDILGTPGRANKPINVTATSTPIATATKAGNATAIPPYPPILGISEFLPRPGFDWNGDRRVDTFDEFVELINAGQVDVELGAYQLDDEENLGSTPFTLPKITLKPGERAVFYASQSGVLLSDAGDSVRLLKGKSVVDSYTYRMVRSPDQSWCRLPDRMGYWNDPCFPTPNNPNALTGALLPQPAPASGYQPPLCLLPDTTPQEFVYAECQVGGNGIWNRQHWDRADQARRFILDEGQKWETVFE
jgi:hypothetical protein